MDSCIHLSFQHYIYVGFMSTFKCTKKVGMIVSNGYLQGGEQHRERKGMGALASYCMSNLYYLNFYREQLFTYYFFL